MERSIYKWLLLPTALLYWLVCFAPFNWVTPLAYVQNDAYLSTPSRNSDGSPDRPRTLHLGGTGLARFDLKNPGEANLAPAQLHLSLNVQCEHSEQFGPARIATLSDTTSARHFMLGQEGTALVLRWLRPDSNNNGLPEFVINDFFTACKPRQLTIVAVGGGLRVTSDGHTLLNLPAPSSSMQRWITDYPLLLGNEASWNRGWAGQIWGLDLQIDSRKISQDWKNIQIPKSGWRLSQSMANPQRIIWLPFSKANSQSRLDNVLNVLGFLPFGALLAFAFVGRLNFWQAGAIAALLSLSIELGQLGFEGRFSSATDIATNTVGGTLGFLLAKYFRSPQSPD